MERDIAWDRLDIMESAAENCDTIDQYLEVMNGKAFEEPPRILPGSDVGSGQLVISHWATRLMATSFIDLFENTPGAVNYLAVLFTDRKSREIEVILQKPKHPRPADLVARYKGALEKILENGNLEGDSFKLFAGAAARGALGFFDSNEEEWPKGDGDPSVAHVQIVPGEDV